MLLVGVSDSVRNIEEIQILSFIFVEEISPTSHTSYKAARLTHLITLTTRATVKPQTSRLIGTVLLHLHMPLKVFCGSALLPAACTVGPQIFLLRSSPERFG
jgi:hypothetical protein